MGFPGALFLVDAVTSLGGMPVVEGRPAPNRSPFGRDSTAEDVTAGMDLAGKTALVTGCNSGLGLETMRVLAMRGAHVIGAARTAKKAKDACESVEGKTTPLVVELTDLPGIVAGKGLQLRRGGLRPTLHRHLHRPRSPRRVRW